MRSEILRDLRVRVARLLSSSVSYHAAHGIIPQQLDCTVNCKKICGTVAGYSMRLLLSNLLLFL